MPPYDGVIFDMDGTLVDSPLDFTAIRADLGVPEHLGILEALAKLPPPQRSASQQRLLEHELVAARQATAVLGAEATLAALRSAGLPLALLTRNSRAVYNLLAERFAFLDFDLVLCREDGAIKPEPDGILRACASLGIAPQRTACVGDYRYDMLAANAAGACSILLTVRRETPDYPEWADLADHTIDRLEELPPLLGLAPAGKAGR